MSKLMLTRASTVVLKNRRRYSMRTRNGRPRRQSAPTVLQRAPPSPRGYPPASPSHALQRGGVDTTRYLSTNTGNTFTYPHPGAHRHAGDLGVKEHNLRRGSVQPHHLSGGSSGAQTGDGGGLSPRASIYGPPSSYTSSAAVNATTLASANAALREVKLDSPKLRRITFQDWKRQKQEEQDQRFERQGHISLSPSGQQLDRVVSLSGGRSPGECSSLLSRSPCDCESSGVLSLQVVLDNGLHCTTDPRCHILKVSAHVCLCAE